MEEKNEVGGHSCVYIPSDPQDPFIVTNKSMKRRSPFTTISSTCYLLIGTPDGQGLSRWRRTRKVLPLDESGGSM